MGKQVSVFVCGVQKGGTTTLYAYLKLHPELSHCDKEPHFFDDETKVWPLPNYDGLEGKFAADDGDRLRFEVTPNYLYWPQAIPRLHAYNPDAKIILLFRDPFDRAWSQWCMQYGRTAEDLPFAEAIRTEQERLKPLGPRNGKRRVFSYIDRGLYGKQMKRLFDHFPKSQVLALRSTDLWSNHTATLGRITDFLGIKPFPDIEPIHEFKGARKIELPSVRTQEDLDFVANLVADDMREFAELTNLDISDWPVMRDR